jgi:NodT family efflux transporter outer membrane factor (OMF) lipoprotein
MRVGAGSTQGCVPAFEQEHNTMASLAKITGRTVSGAACLAGAVLAGLAGCTVGPNFQPPAAPAAASGTSYTPVALPEQTASAPGAAGAAQRLVQAQDIPAQWWTVFHSEPLDRLIRSALDHNPSVTAAQAALRQAQETYNATSGSLLYPSVGAQFTAERERYTSLTGPGLATYNLFTPGLSVSYALDMFGGNRRTLEGLAAAVDYQRYQIEGTYLTLASNVVATAIREASLRAQLKATLEVLASQERQLAVVQSQFAAGAIARSIVLSQSTQVAQTRASLPPLEKSLAQSRHQLSVYAGQLPSEPGIPEFELESLQLPLELPVTLPSTLVRQRPDIRASEAVLHQASAEIGVATANEYPQLELTGTAGIVALKPSQLFHAANKVWTLSAGLTAPIFNGGALAAKTRAAQAAYDEAQAQYQSTVLQAFQSVADALRAIESDATALRTQAQAEALAHEALDLSTRQYQLGAVSYLALLDAQRAYQQTRIGLVQAQAARYTDTAALFQALGGGWWSHAEAAASPVAAVAPASPREAPVN